MRARLLRFALTIAIVAGVAVPLFTSSVAPSAASPPSTDLSGCWQLSNQDLAFSIYPGSSTAVVGQLIDSQSTAISSETCDADEPVANLSGSDTPGSGYIAYITDGNEGWAITAVKDASMSGYLYWVGATAAPTPAPSYGKCEAEEQANKSDP